MVFHFLFKVFNNYATKHDLIPMYSVSALLTAQPRTFFCQTFIQPHIFFSILLIGTVDGPWHYISERKQMYHKGLKKCLGLEPETGKPILRPCDKNNAYHKWVWKENKPYWAKKS